MRELVRELKRIVAQEEAKIADERASSHDRGYREGYRDACLYLIDALEEMMEE